MVAPGFFARWARSSNGKVLILLTALVSCGAYASHENAFSPPSVAPVIKQTSLAADALTDVGGRSESNAFCLFPTIICNSGKPAVCVPRSSDSCGISECLIEHERRHLDDMARDADDVCENRMNGETALISRARKVQYEIAALATEKACLGRARKNAGLRCKRDVSYWMQVLTDFEKACDSSIDDCKPQR